MLIRVPESAGRLYERIQYPAGELQIRLMSDTIQALFKRDDVMVLCREAHKHLLELALLADAIHHLRPFIESTLVLPYLPYARADRRFTEGDCAGLKTFGEIINNMRFHEVRTLDVHSFRAQAYVSRLKVVNARPLIARAIADIADHGGHPVVLLPDEGAKRYGLDGALQASKKRDAATGRLSGFGVPSREAVGTHDVLLVDDICDGGGTFIGLAEALQDKLRIGCMCPNPKKLKHCPDHGGVKNRLYLYVTHGIFSKGLEVLFRHFAGIYTTNSMGITYVDGEGGTQHGFNLKVFDCEPELLGDMM